VVAVVERHRIVLITTGDLFHQERMDAESGRGDLFQRIEIVSEKDRRRYAGVLAEFGVDPGNFVMIGNSMRSDIEPVVALGGWGIHMPYHVTWDHELEHGVESGHARVIEVASADELAAAVARCERN
jgi:putative hydrolase of the HAD superfamily